MTRIWGITVAALVATRPAVAAQPVDDATVPAATQEPPADATPSVEELELRAQAAFEAGRYREVVELAAEAYARTGELRHLYAQAHAERKAGNCEAALGLYARVMAAEPDDLLGQHARDGIKLCEEQIQRPPPPTEVPRPVVEPTPRGEPSTPPVASPRIDPLGTTMLALGIVALAGATGFAVLTRVHARRLHAATDERALLDEQRRARGYEGATIAVGVAGSALVIAGIVRLVQRRPHRRR